MEMWAIAVLLFLGAIPMGVEGQRQGGVEVYAENPWYWQYGGRPVLLLGGSVEDNLFQIPDLTQHLEALAAAGGNYVRCTMSSRDKGNVWPFGKVGDLYDLDQWNEEYWRRFSAFLAETHKRDVIVQVEVWATFDFYRDNWDRNPFNPRNNSTYTVEESGLPAVVDSHPVKTESNFFWSVPAENNQRTVLKYQQRFVDKLLSHALQHDHVLYCMDNETSVTAEWGAYWSNYIRDAAAKAGKKVHTTEMWDAHSLNHRQHRATFEHPETYSFVDVSQNNHQKGQAHYDNAQKVRQRIVEPVRPMNNVKIYGADTGTYGSTRDAIERFWRNIFGGMAAARFHRPASGIGLSELARRMIRSAREVTGAFNIFRCGPRPDLLGDRDENEAYCLADAGREYAVYFPGRGDVSLDLAAAKGRMELRWYQIDAGRWHEASQVQGGGRARLTTPGSGQWVALIR